ncbi:EscU/YscU/HrcU family type III secretion system export apparatus switch protein [Pseudomonas fluvialis]|jgi:flagellar biosynthesis protein|uniref:EscU/YscU/HrcU family type III secretion system export apparatus switch protein n=1 Tax=Pseudomonas fluvialis TaxID=1793966 RepID=UPI0035AE2849
MSTSKHQAPRQAIALRYDGRTAPNLTAKGDDELAEAILAIAREYEVPIYENAELVKLLARLELGEAIPEALYRTIAEIIAFAWHLRGKCPPPRGTASDTVEDGLLCLAGPGGRKDV